MEADLSDLEAVLRLFDLAEKEADPAEVLVDYAAYCETPDTALQE